jgi:hypothetical protein
MLCGMPRLELAERSLVVKNLQCAVINGDLRIAPLSFLAAKHSARL